MKVDRKRVDDTNLVTASEVFTSLNTLEVEVGTTGYCGGDAGHGARTYFRLTDLSSTAMKIETKENNEVVIKLSGDTEISTFIQALSFAEKMLKIQAQYNRCDEVID